MFRCSVWIVVCFAISTPTSFAQSDGSDFTLGVRESDPQTPAQEQASFTLPAGFQVQLFAAEPQIAKPLNMAFDARGRLWVTDTLEYPYPVPVDQPGRDSIKVLEDTNGDGRADKVTTFADGLNIPIGLYPYKDGVVCYSIPHIWRLRDTDDDGVCDQRQVLYGPFDHTRDTHGMCNAFTRGYDGWLYACHGFNNQSSVKGGDGHPVTMHSGNTFRLRLDGSRIEHYTHGQVNPFGMSYDARGDLLTADCHTKPVTLLLPGGYYESFGKPHDGLGFVPPVMDHLHGSTAIGGIAVSHSGTHWPKEFQNNSFGGNVMTSRINRNSLIYSGASLRAQQEADFLISSDSWFRPVDLQFGPDGALYVADFYNRIIGHYEVPLDHPGRDRKRGRIWRITYQPRSRQSESGKVLAETSSFDLASTDVQQLVRALGSPSWTARMLATDRLADEELGRTDVVERGLQDVDDNVRLHCLWVLYRRDAVQPSHLNRALTDSSELVRTHAQRVLGELGSQASKPAVREKLSLSDVIRGLESGLADDSPLVARAAASSCIRLRHQRLAAAVLQRYLHSDPADVHLRHALKIALKYQLADADVWAPITRELTPESRSLVADVCLAIPGPSAADFLVHYLVDQRDPQPSQAAEMIRQATRYCSLELMPPFVQLVRERFAADQAKQLETLQSIRTGLQRRRLPLPESVHAWALDLADHMLTAGETQGRLAWSAVAESGETHEPPTWVVSERRDAADGQANSTLWSSFPNGEQRTGVFRSAMFSLGELFGFYLAGHDGYPQQSLQGNNLVRVRDGRSHEVLKVWSPPRQDTAVYQEWRTGNDAGREVYVELVDHDPADAYAWLAVGRFTEQRLNPSRAAQERQLACQLITDFELAELQPRLAERLLVSSADRQAGYLWGQTLASLRSPGLAGMVEALRIAQLPEEVYQRLARGIADPSAGSDGWAALTESLPYATTIEQRAIVDQLSNHSTTVDRLLEMVADGQLGPHLLVQQRVKQQLEAIVSADQKRRLEELTDGVEDESEVISRVIADRVSEFLKSTGNAARGRKLFETNCANCHQVAGRGKQVGPNLDGIGNRGLVRLAEDVLAPSRNVDVAFRATTVVTVDGRASTGLVRATDEAVLQLVDSEGKTIEIPEDQIEEKSASRLSPMPGNFSEVLSRREFSDLMSYLLGLTK